MLSAALDVAIPQDAAMTGHIGSIHGDVRCVHSFPAKVAAAALDEGVERLIHPALEEDLSLKVLSPSRLREAQAAIIRHKREVKTVGARDIHELVRCLFPTESIVLGGLRRGFYRSGEPAGAQDNIPEQTARHLLHDHPGRFWTALNHRLLAAENHRAKELIKAFADHHFQRGRYPTGVGGKLLDLLRSLPPALRRVKLDFPLLPTEDWLALGRVAAVTDADDLRALLDAIEGKNLGRRTPITLHAQPDQSSPDDDATVSLETILSAIEEEAIAEHVGIPIEQARATYTLERVTVESDEAFLDILTAYFLHLTRWTQAACSPIDPAAASAEALALLDRAFQREGGARAGLDEARRGSRGGLRHVLDQLTRQYKAEQEHKYMARVFAEALGPMDFEARVAFVKALMQRFAPLLPEQILAESPEKWAHHAEALVRVYLDSRSRLEHVMRQL